MIRFLKNIFRKTEIIHEEMNVINSMANAKKLYKELIIRAHPDKHPDKTELAQSMTERINNNRYNYNELFKLKKIVDSEL